MSAPPNFVGSAQNGDWTVVLPRRRKQRRKYSPKLGTLETKPWAPTDNEPDAEIQSKLMKRILLTLTNLESSDFYHTLVTQIQAPQMMCNISRVLSSEPKMQMVIYGIGNIELYEAPRLQLSLAILLRRKFNWISGIEIFDPVILEMESRVMEGLGCTVLSINELGRREVKKPTMFYMPHCEAELYDNLLQTNWKPERLNQMVMFGNSFECYERYLSQFKSSIVVNSARYVLGARRFVEEVKIDTVSEDFFRAFHDTSLHFFHLSPEMEMNHII